MFCPNEFIKSESGSKPTPPPKFRCLSWSGRFPNPEDCGSYFQCSNGNPHMMPCPEGLHYSVRSQRCEQPCDANCEKSLACECKWPTCGLDDLCSLLPKIGPCRAGFQKYYFNRSTGICETFIYGGCQPNKNNFEKKEECEKACPIGNRSPVDEYTEQSEYEHTEQHADTYTEQPVEEYTERHADRYTKKPEDEYTDYKEQQANRHTEPPTDEYSEQPVDEYTEEPTDEYTELPAEEVLDPSFECGPDGLYPHAKNCRSFVKCEKKVPTLNSCPKEQHFNNKTKKCESPCKAHCDRTYACKCKWPTCGTNLLCSKAAKRGICHGNFTRFYFNKRSGNCETFTYGGCLGNKNNFHTKKSCERKCKHSIDICKLPYKTGMCKGNFTRYYFNHKEEKCETFRFGGCQKNDNNFESLEECQTTCLRKPTKMEDFTCERDGLFKDPESCSSYIHCMNGQKYDMPCPTGYHFNEKTKLCEEPSKAQCQEHGEDQLSAAPRCNLSPEKGPCKANIPRWYYNSLLKSCSLFTWGGCKGNDNNFQSKKDCESRCKRGFPHSEEVCRLPAEKGSCDGSIQRYYFNHNEGKCTKFIYGGCEGNQNNFESREECEKSCLRNREVLNSEPLCTEDGVHSDFEDCGQFIRCSNGKSHIETCPRGLHFNEESGQCDSPCDSRCDMSLAMECGWPMGGVEKKHPVLRCLPANDTWGNIDDCSTYYYCKGENVETELLHCPAGKHYSASLKRCVEPCDAYCEPSMACQCGWPNCKKNTERECVEDSKLKVSGNCRRYIHCVNGQRNIRDCPEGLHFNEETGECDSPCDARCDLSLAMQCGWPMGGDEKKHPVLRCLPANDTWGNIDDCSTYYYCKGENVETELLHCPTGKHYSASLKRCVDPCDAYCEPALACQCGWPNCKKTTERECVKDGKFKDSGNCRRYIHCVNGQRNIQDCPEGLHFNESTGECDSPCGARCDSSLALECGWPMGKEFQCPRRNGNFPYPGNDHKYFKCENNVPIVKECQEHQLFDHYIEDCLYHK